MKIKGISPLKGIKKWALEGALDGGGPQYSIAGTCIWANKSNPNNIGVHVGGPQYSISSTCIWASKSNPMGKGMCLVVGRAGQVAGVLEECGVGDVNERHTM